VKSENPSGAGNQQERPLVTKWVVGSFEQTCFLRRKPAQLLESSEAIRQPPDIDATGEDMVLASWRHGEF
jgi:hypothetical protein